MSVIKESDLYNRLLNRLFEQEEPEEPEEAAEEEADEEPAEEETADQPDDSPEEAESDDSEDGEKGQASVDPEDSTSLDSDIEAVFIDFETSARESAVQESVTLKQIYENADEINLDDFAADVARLVKNYDNLLDIESLLVGKAKEFIEKRYGKEASDKLETTLDDTHSITAQEEPDSPPDSDLEVPLAVGATPGE